MKSQNSNNKSINVSSLVQLVNIPPNSEWRLLMMIGKLPYTYFQNIFHKTLKTHVQWIVVILNLLQ